MKNFIGKQVPQVIFKTRKNNQFVDLTSEELFKDQTVVLFSLPGAFTPTCSSSHLPRYNELADTFKQNGVDRIICLSVNDTFVMEAWQEHQEANNITLIPDGNGHFTAGMGMLVDKAELGFGMRSWRYSMLVKNGLVEKQFIEPDLPGDPFEVSDADTMLDYINPKAKKPAAISIMTRAGCPFCAKAKTLLQQHNMPFEEISLGKETSLRSVRAITGAETVPQIFIEGLHIGGSEALEAYLKEHAVY